MPRPFIILPLKTKDEFINDSEYIKYCKKRYEQRCNYEYRQREKQKKLNIGEFYSQPYN